MKDLTSQDLINFREKMGYSRKQFAEMINTPVTTYLKWERGHRRVPGIMAFVHQELNRKGPLS